jgi:DNA-binding CsgD family transcriptional regulator
LLAEEAERYGREAGDKISIGWASLELGVVSRNHDDDLSRAKAHLETGLAFFREARYISGVYFILLQLAVIELMVGNPVRAQRYVEEVLISLGEYEPDNLLVPGAFAIVASIARAHGQLERAAMLCGTASIGITPWVRTTIFNSDSVPMENELAALREQLGEAAFAEAWEVGKAMTREQAIAYALEGTVAPAEDADESEKTPFISPSLADPLNARELEVLRLVASDLPNREIAAKLFVTVNTVKWYLKGIFGKLDVASRAQAVARARAVGLLAKE